MGAGASPVSGAWLVVGGTAGIGLAVAERAATDGARVVVLGRSETAGKAALERLADVDGEVDFVAADIGSEPGAAAGVADAIERLGSLDVVVNAVAEQVKARGPLEEVSAEECASVLGITLTAAIAVARHSLPALLESQLSALVTVGSVVGTRIVRPESAVYGAAKAGLVSFTRALAVGYADRGLSVYTISPWMTDTPGLDRVVGGDAALKHELASEHNPSGRLLDPDEVARVILDVCAGRMAVESGDALVVAPGPSVDRLDLVFTPVWSGE